MKHIRIPKIIQDCWTTIATLIYYYFGNQKTSTDHQQHLYDKISKVKWLPVEKQKQIHPLQSRSIFPVNAPHHFVLALFCRF
jgi:DNA mismatch repair protein MutH